MSNEPELSVTVFVIWWAFIAIKTQVFQSDHFMPSKFIRTVSALIHCLIVASGLAILAAGPATGEPSRSDNAPVILVVGDSLSAEYGLKRGSGWVRLLQDQLIAEGFPHRIVNASISGETTAGGLSRLEPLLKKHKPSLVLFQLGANDGLRGLAVSQTERNLSQMITLAGAYGAQSVIIGIRMPPNYGQDYSVQFDGLFSRLGLLHQARVVPFLLEGFAEDRKFFQADGIHPNESAQPRMLAHVWTALAPALRPTVPQ